MSEPKDTVDAFTHTVAIELSRALNLPNPNDLLARRVIQIARNDRHFENFVSACQTFGRFKREFLNELFTKITDHAAPVQQRHDPVAPAQQRVAPNMTENTSEVLVLGNQLPGGLVGGLVGRNKSSSADEQRPIFKVPAPRVSLLGLDELARKKRAAELEKETEKKNQQTHYEKKVKVDATCEWDDVSTEDEALDLTKQHGRYRSRRMETPSHPGGLSSAALLRMEAMKRKEKKGTTYGSKERDERDERDRYMHSSSISNSSSRSSSSSNNNNTNNTNNAWRDARRPTREMGEEGNKDRALSEGAMTPRRGGLIKRSQWGNMTPSVGGEPMTPRMSTGGMTPRYRTGSSSSSSSSMNTTAKTGEKSEWDFMTPAIKSTAYEEGDMEYPEEYPGDDDDRQRWEEEQAQLDRDWYHMEESGVSQ
ncbi:hypothetical protein BDF14DRAFT_551467 [Spinellus fusiger]|nr:hypothetical protein BDF14DRAFT_551467 [Spinellus fusiger]